MKNKFQVFTVVIPYGDYEPDGEQETPAFTAVVRVGAQHKSPRAQAIRNAVAQCAGSWARSALVPAQARVFKGDINKQEI